MADQGSNFSLFQDMHLRINVRIGISISIKPMITKYGKQVHLQELTQKD